MAALRPTMRCRLFATFLSLVALSGASSRAADAPDAEKVVSLPPFMV
jgi:hypothetical protein